MTSEELRALEPVEHTLQIKSLRYLEAVCSCGNWWFKSPTFVGETDDEIRSLAAGEHRRHVLRYAQIIGRGIRKAIHDDPSDPVVPWQDDKPRLGN
jgi:hypothetical protein